MDVYYLCAESNSVLLSRLTHKYVYCIVELHNIM